MPGTRLGMTRGEGRARFERVFAARLRGVRRRRGVSKVGAAHSRRPMVRDGATRLLTMRLCGWSALRIGPYSMKSTAAPG
ncbi:hypothetical protein D4Q52_12690 [Rhodopseudomonas palustris]|uniref:Uncharacterized protein n=1 Tax=Rhodopseudomonas palustris TaxID=1076 RepID=A0A418VE28_RHOPL|nr:hypothetical protein D4Q52_12690 [Rhodopseudomonas palustris]